jgi:hypothetical protein
MALHPILHGVGIALVLSAGSISIGVIAASIAPQWQRICRLALGQVEPSRTARTRQQGRGRPRPVHPLAATASAPVDRRSRAAPLDADRRAVDL